MSMIAPPAPTGGEGLSNPTLALNLSAAADWTPGQQFIDLMRLMRPWTSRGPEGTRMSAQELREGGHVDTAGYPTGIPEGQSFVTGLFEWKDITLADPGLLVPHVLTWEGQGRVEMTGVQVLSSEPGRIVFVPRAGENMFVDIHETDPEGTGELIRDIHLVAERNLPLFEVGASFNPDWVELVADARQLRFMDWAGTNDSGVVNWDDLPLEDGPSSGTGHPASMVRLANEVGADAWFTMPHQASDAFIKAYAIYVRDTLDPALTVRIEYSNETWNWKFAQTAWLAERSEADWGETSVAEYHVKMATRTAQIWREVFEAEPERLVTVLGAQTVNPEMLERMLDPQDWRAAEPDAFVPPSDTFDEIAVTSYFGGATLRSEEMTADLLRAIEDPQVDAAAWYAARLLDPGYEQSIPDIASHLEVMAQIAHGTGMGLVLYEGGQHVFHKGQTGSLPEADEALLREFMEAFVGGPEMAALYRASWESWEAIGDGPYMQFGDVTSPSEWGNWGIYDSLAATTPRADALAELNGAQPSWWGDAGGAHHLQGVTHHGTDGADAISGTAQEDHLSGGNGDDVFAPGGGNDGVHGGAGLDTVILAGLRVDHLVTVEGAGYRVSGPGGSDLLMEVERLVFDDAAVDLAPCEVPAEDPADGGSVQDGPCPDETRGGVGDDVLEGGPGDDVLWGKQGADLLRGGGGSDLLHGGSGPDDIRGEAGDDELDGGGGADTMRGGDGADLLRGGGGADLMRGEAGDDAIHGGAGDDAGWGGAGDDTMHGDAGADELWGEVGSDLLKGGAEEDLLRGGSGADRLEGGAGADLLDGGAGSDVLVGGTGNDAMTGGAGGDLFVFGSGAGGGHDVITDFERGDRLSLGDFLKGSAAGADLAGAARELDGDLLLSNGTDTIRLVGLGLDDLDLLA